jgi:2-polyprenyl-3-methyl-5-hydroxy-6-metoxy-1,4-benzoquinol methylase
MSDFDEIFQLIKYDPKTTDVVADSISELSAILDCDSDAANRLVTSFLDYYHYGKGERPAEINDDLSVLLSELTRPFRIPFTVEIMKPLLDGIGVIQGKDVLDYGAGSGKDTIMFSRLGASVTYAEIATKSVEYTKKRFEIRHLHYIEIEDVARLDPDRRFDVVNCFDVLQLVYDVEYVLADVIARLQEGGHLILFACFENQWDGSHIEKNCGYLPYFTEILLSIGLEPVMPVRNDGFAITRGLKSGGHQTYLLRRRRPIRGSITEERETIRKELYGHSLRYSERTMRWCATALPLVKLFRRDLAAGIADNLFDNYGINRLSKYRLAELANGAHA